MRVLVVNCGSSTLKFELFEMKSALPGEERCLARGIIDRISSSEASVRFETEGDSLFRKRLVSDHREASLVMLARLGSSGLLEGLSAVGHRIIHGGDFRQTTIINEDVVAAIEALTELAPLHNKPSLEAVRVLSETLGPQVPMVAVFDTAFHRTLPDRARLYAIPQELAEKNHIQRYGFHGLAHRYMAERCAELMGKPLETLRLVTLQLGNGCSATAVNGGKSVDTSMGLTPLEGLVMGTRSGDVDPTLAGFLARREKIDVETAEDWLNTKSGLLGVSERSGDMRELLEAERSGDAKSALAIDMFCYRVRKYIGAYIAALEGADGITFGGGIGENAPEVRAHILSGMEWCGVKLDEERNGATIGKEALVSADNSRISVYVILVKESLIIARETLSCLAGKI